jgi:diguanylate cyclase
MLRFVRTVLWSSKRLPESVFAELVNIVYTSMPPVALIGCILVAVGSAVAIRNNDSIIWILVASGVGVTAGRVALILAYRRKVRLDGVIDAKAWDSRYAIGAYLFAVVLGVFNFRATATGDPMVAMLVTSLMFGYGAGIVARLGVRPIVCVVSLALAVMPTASGYLFYATKASDVYVTSMYVTQAFLLIVFAFAGTEAMGHIYKTTLQQLLTRQDLIVLAGQDGMTGLPNRTLLRARLNEGIVQTRRTETLLAFHCLDLDHFKAVNDTLGHPAGDALLKQVADRLTSTSRIGDTVARVGGDEFVVLQVGIKHEDEAALLARRIARTLSAPFVINGSDVQIGVTIGIAVSPKDGVTLERLNTAADAALYEAKRKGRGTVMFSDRRSPASSATAA